MDDPTLPSMLITWEGQSSSMGLPPPILALKRKFPAMDALTQHCVRGT